MPDKVLNEKSEVKRIKELLKRVRRIEIKTRHKASEMLSGHYRSVFKGRGIEFSEVRDYVFGDSIKQIEWNVTARMAKPFIKQFVEERELNILLAVDVSSSMYFSSYPSDPNEAYRSRNFKIDIASEIIATLSVSANMNNDKIGLILYSDEIRKYIPQKKSRDQPMRIIRELIYHRPKKGISDMRHALRYIMNTQKKRGVLFIISDFDSIDDYRELSIANKKFDIIPIVIKDRRELELKDFGFISGFDPETGEEFILNTKSKKVRDSYNKIAKEKEERRRQIFKKNGIDFIEIFSEEDYVPKLLRFFKKREKIMSL